MVIACDELEGTLHQVNTESSMDKPAGRSSSGGWKSARLIIGVEMAEQFAFCGISSNLITYLTGPLGESTAAAAANVNAWTGTVSFLPLLWGFIADSFLGRFRTIVISSSLYILGLGLLSFSAMTTSDTKDSNQFRVILFFCSLYLIAIGQGGYKPCIKVFGADQLNGNDLKEAKAKSSYFNWLMFGSCVSILSTRLVSSYIQEYLNWFLGFGIPSVFMLISLLLFLIGTKSYRYSTARVGKKNPFARIIHVFIEALKNRGQQNLDLYNPNEALLLLADQSSKQFRFLDKAAISCSLAEIEEAKAVLKLVPIWMTCLVYAIICAQSHTFFTKQGATMNRSILPGLLVPAATLQCFISLTMVIFIPLYDRLLVPVARSFTQNPSGITMLQRIGTGIFLSILAIVVAALVETQRLQTARDDVTILMSVWWLVPQYVIFGVADVFTMVGLQEFFYDQVPCELRSVGMALNLSIYGVGNFLSSFMISIIDKVTSQSGQTSWFDNDLNQAHLDYFYWLLACLSSTGLASYLWFAKSYVYNRPNTSKNII
ncbi:PREDICTED: protein NRT1/ PTR FAMILY 5.11-like [Camelina sativa]|uniref:Protein NRT1/ PTR FAMILY 5.11-like n=1 Tax=Camelina sativa TaxID=90675 RepID=A0ABM0T0G8_CAMSA|nr:PREDICTED: protein NRT1/ PTR FAMILY 5.11-like [Camelina sativa]